VNQPVDPDATQPIAPGTSPPAPGGPDPVDATVRMPQTGEPGGPPPIPPAPGGDDGDGDGGNARWWWIAVAAVVVIGIVILVIVLLAGGDDDDDSSAATTSSSTSPSSTSTTQPPDTTTQPPETTTTVPAAPEISSFTGPDSVRCDADTNVQLSWSTENANRTTISIDGTQFGEFGPSQSQSLPFTCDGNSHTYLLTAFGANNRSVTESKTVTQEAPED
jgi:predicted metalloprotease